MPQPRPDKKESSGLRFYLLVILLFVAFFAWSMIHLAKVQGDQYRQYTYRITRELVKTVTEAKNLLEEKGPDAYVLLDRMNSDQLSIYVYLYRSSDALCLYHGENPTLVGKHLGSFVDHLGKPLHKLVTSEIRNPYNPHGWIHYYWHRPKDLFLDWKSSCNLAVTMPDGTKCYVGGGAYGIGAEIEFARIAVNSANHLLETKGATALRELLSPTGPYFFYDTAVFILRKNGRSIIDPILKTDFQREVLPFKDSMGHYPFKHLLKNLEKQSEAQIPLYTRTSESMNLQKKIIYAQRGIFENEPVIVGTVIDAPQSIWMQ